MNKALNVATSFIGRIMGIVNICKKKTNQYKKNVISSLNLKKKINNHIGKPESYISIIEDRVFFLMNTLIRDPSEIEPMPLKHCQNIIEQYISKYDINKYQGDIKVIVKGGSVCIDYKGFSLANSKEDYHDYFSRQNFLPVEGMTRKLISNQEKINAMSFELKFKDILSELQEFYRYLAIHPEKTHLWLQEQLHA